MDYKALIEISENRAAMFHTRRDEGGYIHEENCQRALWELLSRAEAAEAELEQKEKYYSQMVDALAATDSMELTEAKRKLAVAVSDLETVMAYGTGNLNTCIFCKNAQCYARGGTKPCLPKWRGTTPQSRRSRDSSPYTGEP